ncbi:MAG: hypothetical protein K0S32_601 [Bacteroidetes bacterium]|nr:hypothetical protein [Bacteroidota bacterium]
MISFFFSFKELAVELAKTESILIPFSEGFPRIPTMALRFGPGIENATRVINKKAAVILSLIIH